jgi:glycosyltransferase involved in cell wall biosynthesis
MDRQDLSRNAVPPADDSHSAGVVLIVSPHPTVYGGVSTFAELLKERLSRYKAASFWVGGVQGRDESGIAVAARVLGAPFRLYRMVRRDRFAVVHLNPSLNFKSAVRDGLLLLALRAARYRHVLVYFHGWEPLVADRIGRDPILRRVCVGLLNGTGRIMVLAPAFKESLVRMGVRSELITSTRTMFDGRLLAAADAGDAPAERRNVLFLSRFIRKKGVFELVEAFARVAGEFADVDLIMAGDGPEKARLEQRVLSFGLGDRISFPGYVGGRDKAKLLRDCTIFALPTYLGGEGMPIALLEAMAAGKPLLTAKDGGIPQIVSDANGVLLDVVTGDTVVAALRRLLGDRDFCERVGRANRTYAWERFEASKVTAEIEAIYQAVAALA